MWGKKQLRFGIGRPPLHPKWDQGGSRLTNQAFPQPPFPHLHLFFFLSILIRNQMLGKLMFPERKSKLFFCIIVYFLSFAGSCRVCVCAGEKKKITGEVGGRVATATTARVWGRGRRGRGLSILERGVGGVGFDGQGLERGGKESMVASLLVSPSPLLPSFGGGSHPSLICDGTLTAFSLSFVWYTVQYIPSVRLTAVCHMTHVEKKGEK